MVNRLQELMNDLVGDPPPDEVNVPSIVRSARRRARTRSAVVVGAVVVALAVVVPVIREGGASRAGLDSPAAATYLLADAPVAVEGSDFTVLDELVLGDVSDGSRTEWRGVTEDGLILVERDSTDRDAIRLGIRDLGLRDPSQGITQWLPDAPGAIRDVVALDDTQLVFITGRTSRSEVMVFDRGGATWRSIDWPGLPDIVYSPRLDSTGRLHVLAASASASAGPVDVWSASLDDPGDATVELEGVELADLSDDQLSWTTPGAPETIYTRDLTTGSETGVDVDGDVDGDAGCRSTRLSRDVDRLVLEQTCSDADQVVVLALDGTRQATIRGPALNGATLLDDVVLVSTDDSVQFMIDRAGRLRRLNEGTTYALGGPGAGDLALINNGEGEVVRQQLIDLG